MRSSPPARRGIAALEVLIAAVLASILAFGVIALLYQGNHEAMVSEDYMMAEALAQRHLADAMSVPWDQMAEGLPRSFPIEGVPEADAAVAAAREEYARNLEGPVAFRGALEVRELAPGLLAFEVSLAWPVHPGSKTLRRYALVRLRSRKDLAVSSHHRMRLPRRRPDGNRGRS